MPVIVDGWRAHAGTGPRLATVDDQRESEEHDDADDEREDGAALEAHLLAFALLSELGDFFGG